MTWPLALWKRWSEAAKRFIIRCWTERNAGIRAIAPAWPVTFIVTVTILVLVFTEQGKEALLATADTSSHLSQLRLFFFAFAVALFGVATTLSALFIMSVRPDPSERAAQRLPPDADEPSDSLRASSIDDSGDGTLRFAEDPIHASVSLRRFVAFLAGMAAPTAIFLFYVTYETDLDDALPDASGAFILTAAALLLAHRAFDAVEAWLAGIVKPKALAAAERTKQTNNGAIGAGSFITLLLLRGVYAVALTGFRVTKLFPTLIASVFVALNALSRNATEDLEPAALQTAAAVVLAAATYSLIRRSSMRVIAARDRKQLIVDRTQQTIHSGLVLISIILIFGVLRWGYNDPSVIRLIGPATIALAGAYMTIGILLWFVRMAMAPASNDGMRRTPRFWPLLIPYWIGRVGDVVQRFLTAQRVLGFGVFLLILDGVLLPNLEKSADGAGPWPVAGAVIGAAALAWLAIYLSYLVSMRVPMWGGWLRPSLLPPPERALRLASPLLLAPFVLATLGADQTPRGIVIDQAERPTVEAHASAWLSNALDRAAPGAPIPAIVVLAEGGGMRAASHVGSLLVALDETYQSQRGQPVLDNIYALSGVSGGSIGIAAYLASRAEANAEGSGPSHLRERVDSVLDQDQLSPLLAGLFAGDLVTTFIPTDLWARLARAADPVRFAELRRGERRWKNRADYFEAALSHRRTQAADVSRWFGSPIEYSTRVAAGPGRVAPVVVFGAFSAQEGLRAAASNVEFNECPEPGIAQQQNSLVTLQDCLERLDLTEDETLSLSLATAAHISSRFPFANPPATFERQVETERFTGWRDVHFVDGGYFDNSGATAASYAVAALRAAALDLDAERCDGQPRNCVSGRLRVIILHAFVREQPGNQPGEQTDGFLAEIAAPLSALIGARKQSALAPSISLCRQIAEGAESDREICAQLASWRCRQTENSPVDPCVPGLAGEIVRAGYDASNRQLRWINAPLDNVSPGDPNYLLLGWLMRSKSHDQIATANNQIVAQIYQALEDDAAAPQVPAEPESADAVQAGR